MREAPPILDLEEHEKFRDDTGNIHEVEVRGVRDEDKIFFKASDIERLFEMENLVHDIIRKIQTTVYKHGEDYVFFLITQKGHGALSGLSEHRVKTTFLTYNGLIKVIYRSNSGTAHKFRKWATGVIYTAHLGTEEQRDELALELTGINHNIVRQTFSACPVPLSCIYLFRIGEMKAMKQSNHELSHLDISGTDHFMCKFGLSNDLSRRIYEQFVAYTKNFKGSSFKMLRLKRTLQIFFEREIK